MSSSVRSGRTVLNSSRHCGLSREILRPAAPVCQTLNNQIQSNPAAAQPSIVSSLISARVTRLPASRDRPWSQTRVLIWNSDGYRGVVAMALIPLDTLYSLEGGGAAGLEIGVGIEMPKDFDQRRHQPGPAGLVTGADAGAVVAMEIFVEQQVIPPVGIALELFGAAEHRPPPILIAQKDRVSRLAISR